MKRGVLVSKLIFVVKGVEQHPPPVLSQNSLIQNYIQQTLSGMHAFLYVLVSNGLLIGSLETLVNLCTVLKYCKEL